CAPASRFAPAGEADGADLVGHGVALGGEEGPATRDVGPGLGRPSGGVPLEVEIGAPLLGGGGVGVRPRRLLAVVAELRDVAGPAVRAGHQDHGSSFPRQWPTAAAPFSPTSRPPVKRARSKPAMRSGGRPEAMSSATASP